MPERPSDCFAEVSAPKLAHPDVARGTMMGFPCLRVADAFFASCDPRSGDLIVKLPRERVQELIGAGIGKPFAPAGRTFREWVVIDDRDEIRRAELIDEACAFVAAQR